MDIKIGGLKMKNEKTTHVAEKHLDLKINKEVITKDLSTYDVRTYKTKHPDFSDALKGRTIKLKTFKR
jgi:predicted nucleic-acid-binding protein